MKKLITVGLGILVAGSVFLMLPRHEPKTSQENISVDSKVESRSPAKESAQATLSAPKETSATPKASTENKARISPEIEEAVNAAVNEILGPPLDDMEQFQETERLPLADI